MSCAIDDEWTPKLAEEAADAAGIVLGEKHWQIIVTSRELIASNGRAPSLAELSATCGVALADLEQLFPGVAEDILARLAGAPELEKEIAI